MELIEKKIITHGEWSLISDAIFHVRKAYNKPDRASDEERLERMEQHLGDAMMACRKVRERWSSQHTGVEDAMKGIMLTNKVSMDILAGKGK